MATASKKATTFIASKVQARYLTTVVVNTPTDSSTYKNMNIQFESGVLILLLNEVPYIAFAPGQWLSVNA
jgi:hypothetical protein